MKLYRIRVGNYYASGVVGGINNPNATVALDRNGRLFTTPTAVKLHIKRYPYAYDKLPIYHIEEYELNDLDGEPIGGKRTDWDYGRRNEWICSCGVGHYGYDPEAYKTVHGCCSRRCCARPDFPGSKEEYDKRQTDED